MKHLSTKILILILLLVAVLSGYNYFKKPFLARFANVEQQLELAVAQPTPDPIQVAVDELTVREKILQLIDYPVVLDMSEASLSAELTWIEANRPGFITLFGRTITSSAAGEFIQSTRFSAGFLPLIAVDHEGGTVQRLSGPGFTRLPDWRQVCQMESEARTELFTQSANELAKTGVQIVFAPVVDIARTGSFLGTRACLTEDEVVNTATDYITSFAQSGILSVVKHFPGIGSVASDPHFQLDTVELEAQDTIVFDRILSSFPNIGVMTTHVAVAAGTNGMPCSLSVACLDRFPVNFPEVLLFTDALEMRSASLIENSDEVKSLPEVAIQAAAAGNNVLVFGEKVDAAQIEEVIDALESHYESNENFSRRIDDSVKKIISIKLPQTQQGAE